MESQASEDADTGPARDHGQPSWARALYAGEFLLALIAIFPAWNYIAGEGNLDLIPWYWKCGFSFGLSSSIVGLTAEMVGHPNLARRPTVLWAAACVAIAVAMGAATYYYISTAEPLEEDEEQQTVLRSGVIPANGLWEGGRSQHFPQVWVRQRSRAARPKGIA